LETTQQRFPLTNDPGDPALSSEKELHLFQILPALEALDPEMTRTVMEQHPQLAAAAKRFPRGMQSASEEQPGFDPACDDIMTIGDSDVMYMSEALATDFSAAFQAAHDLYARDGDAGDPNEAPKDCWPSAWEYRNILFKAGQHLGINASSYLERIPDADLRLFAKIELCAAAAGLPQVGGCTVSHTPRRQRRISSPAEIEEFLGPQLLGVRCPLCGWIPRTKYRWFCECGHAWNTFDTRGICPGCQRQWQVTACPQCGEMPAHDQWYAPPEGSEPV
jgi:hypothetical protein